ncbi:MAG: adenylate/guanylate cyclase domain-containing protein [Cyclobacteriaceae bacterium]|nr:adenylate/guanylate cyclase domain-containing protein [Cyclobacteriaceae bacterium]
MKTSGISNFLKLLVSAVTTWVFAAFLFGFTRVWGIETLPAFERVLPFDLSRLLIQLMILGLATGIPFAIVDFILNHGWFNRQKYWFIILVKTVIQVVIAVFSVSILAFVSTNFFEMTTVNIIDFVLSPNTLLWIIFSGIVSSIIYFLQVIRTKVGSRILINLLLGKYHKPRVESRIFMFLDMKDSTTHAENLGHVRFSTLIQDSFSDLTNAILAHKVEVYQYVGDEAVLTWRIDEGFENANCMLAYYTFKNTLKKRAHYYENKYGFLPFFKAGVHLGEVTVSEVGIIKKEIAYHSDVLNTAARIQGKCNEFNAELLVSEDLKIRLERPSFFNFQLIGGISLKGKGNPVNIFKVTLT